jgi:hypothetical protein
MASMPPPSTATSNARRLPRGAGGGVSEAAARGGAADAARRQRRTAACCGSAAARRGASRACGVGTRKLRVAAVGVTHAAVLRACCTQHAGALQAPGRAAPRIAV